MRSCRRRRRRPRRAPRITRPSARLDAMTTALSRPTPPMVSTVENPGVGRFVSRTPEGLHPKAVEAAKEAIRDGECFQIVVAQRFERPTDADPLDIYRVLRSTNPSPYMYLLRFDGFDIVGSSPEAHLKVTGRRALLHPIAGTRWRGVTPEEDTRLAGELLSRPQGTGRARHARRSRAVTTWAGSASRARWRCRSSPRSSATAT